MNSCIHCDSQSLLLCLDLGHAPPSNAYIAKADVDKPELTFPLRVYVCEHCWLMQVVHSPGASELFTEQYAYFSSTSVSWLEHAKRYSDYIIEKLELGASSFVVEIASNDGYLLTNFKEAGIPCLGIEPTLSTADAARKKGIPVLAEFFGAAVAENIAVEYGRADLIVGNNVFAHVPDINDFTAGLKALLDDSGTLTLEFPHAKNLVVNCLFDTVYHEHYSYLSLHTVRKIFEKSGLKVFAVEILETHGGSIRVFGCHKHDQREVESSVLDVIAAEESAGMTSIDTYLTLQYRAENMKNRSLEFLISERKKGKTIVAYGAAAKGNTLLNFSGIRRDLISEVFDAAEAKQGKYLPGSHIPIRRAEDIFEARPDFVIILPWNIADEVVESLDDMTKSGTRFVVFMPQLKIL